MDGELYNHLDREDKELPNEHDEICPVKEEEPQLTAQSQEVTAEMKAQVARYYGREVEEEGIAPRDDLSKVLDQLLGLSQRDATDSCFERSKNIEVTTPQSHHQLLS